MMIPQLAETLGEQINGHPGIDRLAVRATCRHDGTLEARVFLSRKSLATTVATRMAGNAHRRITYAMMEASVGMPDVIPGNVRRDFQQAVDAVVAAAAAQPEFVNGVRGRETLYLWCLRAPEADAAIELMHNPLAEVALREPAPVDVEQIDLNDDGQQPDAAGRVGRVPPPAGGHDAYIDQLLNGGGRAR